MTSPTTRCGYIALLGRPNAGKSTLLNALVQEKLAVVSRKPQTTRNRILGILTENETQLVVLDTPGLHGLNHVQKQNLINTTMNRVALSVASDADLIVYLVDVTKGWSERDAAYLERILSVSGGEIMIGAAKVDAIKQQLVRLRMAEIKAGIDILLQKISTSSAASSASEVATRLRLQARFIGTLPTAISAKRPDSVLALRQCIAERLPHSPWLFGADELTDMSTNFLCSELIREQLFRQLGEEVPYGCAVKIRSLTDKEQLVVIEAQIVLSRKHHKPIVLGKQGSRIKDIGTAARVSLERHFDKKVFLDLSITVAADWIDDQKLIAELAHLTDLTAPLNQPH